MGATLGGGVLCYMCATAGGCKWFSPERPARIAPPTLNDDGNKSRSCEDKTAGRTRRSGPADPCPTRGQKGDDYTTLPMAEEDRFGTRLAGRPLQAAGGPTTSVRLAAQPPGQPALRSRDGLHQSA